MRSGLRRKTGGGFAVLATVLALAADAQAAPTAEQKCQAGKNSAVGKYADCMTKAEKKFVVSGDVVGYTDSQSKCHDKLVVTWGKLENAAIGAGTTCPSTGDQAPVENFMSACVQSVAGALGGGSLGLDPVTCEADLAMCTSDLGTCTTDLATATGNLATCTTSLGLCNGDLASCGNTLTTCEGDLAACEALPTAPLPATGQVNCYDSSNVVTACAGTGQDGAFVAGTARTFTDNGDGTITDDVTGLMWERQNDDGSIHDVDNSYTWADAFTKIATLNGANFAGYSDWRVPNIVELASLRNFAAADPATFPAFNSSCTASCSACSCTRYINDNFRYWSSTYLPGNAAVAEQVLFSYGRVTAAFKTDTRLVRAVRGGS